MTMHPSEPSASNGSTPEVKQETATQIHPVLLQPNTGCKYQFAAAIEGFVNRNVAAHGGRRVAPRARRVVDGDQDFYYHRYAWPRVCPLYGVDDPDFRDEDFDACCAYVITIEPLD